MTIGHEAGGGGGTLPYPYNLFYPQRYDCGHVDEDGKRCENQMEFSLWINYKNKIFGFLPSLKMPSVIDTCSEHLLDRLKDIPERYKNVFEIDVWCGDWNKHHYVMSVKGNKIEEKLSEIEQILLS